MANTTSQTPGVENFISAHITALTVGCIIGLGLFWVIGHMSQEVMRILKPSMPVIIFASIIGAAAGHAWGLF